MFNRYASSMLAAAVLSCSINLAQADGWNHGFKFTAAPGPLTLSTLNCDTPYQANFILTNTGHLPLAPTNIAIYWDDESDTLGHGAVTFVQTGDNDCVEGGRLDSGTSCNLVLSISTCTAGTLERTLRVAAETLGHIPMIKVAEATVRGTVTEDEL